VNLVSAGIDNNNNVHGVDMMMMLLMRTILIIMMLRAVYTRFMTLFSSYSTPDHFLLTSSLPSSSNMQNCIAFMHLVM
jgi:hypothetical protein